MCMLLCVFVMFVSLMYAKEEFTSKETQKP